MLRNVIILLGAALLVAGGCGDGSAGGPGAAPMEPDVVGIRWQWMGTTTPVERIDVAEPSRYTLRLQADGGAAIEADCNGGGGSYELADNRIGFGPLVATRMACPPDSQDAVYLRQLGEVTSYFVEGGELYLEMPYDSGTMRFTRAENQE
jgi:heat shock protein HslJ